MRPATSGGVLRQNNDGGAHLCNRPAVARPIVHQMAPLLEQVAARVGLFNLIADSVRKRHFDHFARVVRALAGPIAKG